MFRSGAMGKIGAHKRPAAAGENARPAAAGNRLCSAPGCRFHCRRPGQRAPAFQGGGKAFERCVVCGEDAFRAALGSRGGLPITLVLRKLRSLGADIFADALAKLKTEHPADVVDKFAAKAAVDGKSEKRAAREAKTWPGRVHSFLHQTVFVFGRQDCCGGGGAASSAARLRKRRLRRHAGRRPAVAAGLARLAAGPPPCQDCGPRPMGSTLRAP